MFRSPRNLFNWSPRSDQDPFASPTSQSPPLIGVTHGDTRSAIGGSSVYSQTPTLEPLNNHPSRMNFQDLFGCDRESTGGNVQPVSHFASHTSVDSRSPIHAQYTAGSHTRATAPFQDLQEPATIYRRHLSDVPLPYQLPGGCSSSEEEHMAGNTNGRKRQQKHKKRRHQRPGHWVRRRNERSTRGALKLKRRTVVKRKLAACLISGFLLVTVLAIYLAIALSYRGLGEEIHIFFIIALLFIMIFFCHSLIRLCILMLHPPRETWRRMPDMTAPEGFQPARPIRVHLARDEEANSMDASSRIENGEHDVDPDKDALPPPPPAYGLWRSSVRADPNLLHWQRIENQSHLIVPAQSTRDTAAFPVLPGSASIQSQAASSNPRPPSYASEEGVSYVADAVPRSTVDNRQSTAGMSDIHPAWRPGYAMSAIRGDEPGWSGRRGVHGII